MALRDLRSAAVFATIVLSWVPESSVASELDAARSDAENGTRSLEQRPCPAFGDRKYLRGMTEPQQLVSAADKEKLYQEGALRQLQQIARDSQLASGVRADLQALASWSIAASMANWSMLQTAQQALANPSIAPGQAFPSAPLETARERVRQLSMGGGLSPDAAAVLRRQVGALDRCLVNFNSQAFKLNQPQFEAAIEAAATLVDLNRVEQSYRVREAVSAGYGGDVVDKLAARRAALAEADRAARESANAANAADATKRQAEAQQRLAELRAKLPAFLATAQRFANAAQSGNEREALNELSRDVVMTTPQGSYRGINAVADAVRRQSGSGGGSLGQPRIEGERIVAYGSRGQLRLITNFSFDSENRISRIDISL